MASDIISSVIVPVVGVAALAAVGIVVAVCRGGSHSDDSSGFVYPPQQGAFTQPQASWGFSPPPGGNIRVVTFDDETLPDAPPPIGNGNIFVSQPPVGNPSAGAFGGSRVLLNPPPINPASGANY